MEIVKEFEFASSRGRGKYTEMLKGFLELPEGTTVKFVQGTDFDGDPKKFSLSLRTTLWNKGFKARINVRPDGVYAALIGKRESVVPVEGAPRRGRKPRKVKAVGGSASEVVAEAVAEDVVPQVVVPLVPEFAVAQG